MQGLAVMKRIYGALHEFETAFECVHHLSINEAIVLSVVMDGEAITSSQIAEKSGFLNSYTSKLIKSLEQKQLVLRKLGDEDKRQMYFVVTEEGEKVLNNMKCGSVAIPKLLQPIFDKECLR